MNLLVRFVRTSPTHHRFEFEREDGTRESSVLETRSCLLHDLVHFAVESEARLERSFYGSLARGMAYADMVRPEAMAGLGAEIAGTECVVGALQGALKSGVAAEAFVAELTQALGSFGAAPPD